MPNELKENSPNDEEKNNTTKKIYPFNLMGNFGSLDATQIPFSSESIKSIIFDLNQCKTHQYSVNWGTESIHSAEFDVPEFFDFKWESENISMYVAGQTKTEFQRNLSRTVSADVSFMGFGSEFSETFSEKDFTETFQKYVVRYERQQIYSVAFKAGTDPAGLLTPNVAKDFESLEPAELIRKYGTHYVWQASFGGLKVFWDKLDIRDEIKSEQLSSAMNFHIEMVDPETGQQDKGKSGQNIEDETVRKLNERMNVRVGRIRGGNPGLKGSQWIESLFVNPALISYRLAPISDLVAPERRAAVSAEIASVLDKSVVKIQTPLVGVRVPIEHYATDKDSGAEKNLCVGRPKYLGGWYYTGQWGLPQRFDFPAGFSSLLLRDSSSFQNNSATTANKPAIVKPNGFLGVWGEHPNWGLYSANAPDGYVAIGDIFERKDYGLVPTDWFYGCIREDLVVPTNWVAGTAQGNSLWTDMGSGAGANGAAWCFENNDPEMLSLSTTPVAVLPRMFKAIGDYYGPDYHCLKCVKVDLTKVTILKSDWL